MQIRTVDGVAHYAKYLLKTKELPGGPIHFPACPACKGGILCFTDRELARAEAWLKEQGIGKDEYKIEELQPPPGFEKTVGVKYASRSEAIAHIEQDIEPESLVLTRLRERVDAAERRAEAAEQKAERAEGMARAAESRLETLEKDIKLTK